ncbi:unnamed protein product [Kuraishia capsulata CBS 1993]|uniref:MINDY deubiquitinase domain-containing protein n=1 Tax=Kuraishia capsulata CBS 1993 TaxID=1382522 RepID=W6MTW6_9ASCO|nr:uncharacterized protein KUCA_T00004696001 [Kuraishia capsulata CBS 1993]CDK28712.1 unnamed protein product [Kuraishia capsulata CBS 1993]
MQINLQNTFISLTYAGFGLASFGLQRLLMRLCMIPKAGTPVFCLRVFASEILVIRVQILIIKSSEMTQLTFKTKTVGWKDGFAGEWHLNNILLQNNNGPCFIISLINSMVISSELRSVSQSWTTVTKSKSKTQLSPPEDNLDLLSSDPSLLVPLKSLLSNREVTLESLLSHLTNLLLVFSENGLDPEDLTGMLNTFPLLHTGLNTDVNFSSCIISSTQSDVEAQVFKMLELFGTSMVHGWIVDPDSDDRHQYELVKKLGHFEKCQLFLVNQLDEIQNSLPDSLRAKLKVSQVESFTYSDWSDVLIGLENEEFDERSELIAKIKDLIAVKRFLTDNQTQLTEYGLKQLQTSEMLPNNSVSIFFRNDHFNTMYKRDGALYLLLIDEGYGEQDRYVWESLSSVSGADNELLDGNFVKAETTGKSDEPASNTIEYSDFMFDDSELNSQAVSDQQFAKELQRKEDERYAKQLQKSFDETPEPRSGRGTKKSKTTADSANANSNTKSAKSSGDSCMIV